MRDICAFSRGTLVTLFLLASENMDQLVIRQGNRAILEDKRRDLMICPKPRRFGLLQVNNGHSVASVRQSHNPASQVRDAKFGTDILGIINSKTDSHVASSPPYFSGSPPGRAANPLIRDARFGDNVSHNSPLIPASCATSSSPSSRIGGCVRPNFGDKPAVRIEGFECSRRDHRNCSIPTVA